MPASDSTDYMRAAAESMGESLFALDDAGKLTFVNPAGAGLLEWSEAELAGRDMHEVAHVQLGGASQHLRDACPIIAPRAAGQVSRVDDDVFTRRDGSVVPDAYTAPPFITCAGAGDREFVRGIRSDNASRQVVRAAVSLAGGFGQQTVAEGVERRATVNLLCDLGVLYGQGYALGRPAPMESLLSGRHHQ